MVTNRKTNQKRSKNDSSSKISSTTTTHRDKNHILNAWRVPINVPVIAIVVILCLGCYNVGLHCSQRFHSTALFQAFHGNVTLPSLSSSRSVDVIDLTPRSQLPEWKDDDLKEHQQQQQQQQQEQQQNNHETFELLVHPALLVHENPKIVAVVSTMPSHIDNLVQEIEKHGTVTKIVAIDISDYILDIDINNENDNSASCSKEDEDDNNGSESSTKGSCSLAPDEESSSSSSSSNLWATTQVEFLDRLKRDGYEIDVVILDSPPLSDDHDDDHDESSPDDEASPTPPLSPLSFFDSSFWSKNYLSPTGILATTVPQASSSRHYDYHYTIYEEMDDIHEQFYYAGLKRMITYHTQKNGKEGKGTSTQKTYFALGLQSFDSLARWHRNEALVTLDLRRRNIDSSLLLQYIDGPIMTSMEFPSKQIAMEQCKIDHDYNYPAAAAKKPADDDENDDTYYYPKLDEYCPDSGFHPYTWNVPKDALKVQRSGIGDNAGRGLFTTVDIPQESYINLAASVYPIRLPWMTTNVVSRLRQGEHSGNHDAHAHHHHHAPSRTILQYFDAYGYVDEAWGKAQYTVESSSLTFMNHGCNGKTNVGGNIPYNEANVEEPPYSTTTTAIPIPDDEFEYYNDNRSIYNPLKERQYYANSVTTASDHDIKAGEEILCNYIFFARKSDFAKTVQELRDACAGVPGYVEQLQNK